MHSPAGVLDWFAALLAAAWVPRCLAVLERGGGSARGFVSDLAAALAATLILVLLAKHRGLRLALGCGWLILHWAAYEHARTLDAPLAVSQTGYLFDPVFLVASVTAISRPLWLLALLLLSGWLLWRPPGISGPGQHRRVVGLFIVGGLTAAGLLLWQTPAGGWRSQGVVPGLAMGLGELLRPSAEPALELDLHADLSGEPWWSGFRVARHPPQAPPHNLVVLVLEGVSGSYLPSIRQAAGSADPGLDLPNLDRLARSHPTAVQFLTQQRQTHRGLWSLLCGRLPRATGATARFTEVAVHGRPPEPPCLPAQLADRGYRTVFLQASPLPFMQKDLVMPLLGFRRVEGDEHRDRGEIPAAVGGWGVDDRTFLRRVKRRILELERDAAPYFLTVLTSGTHHPYTLPGRDDTLAGALRYLDAAVGEWVDGLGKAGVLDHTLLVVTSDESAGSVQNAVRRDELESLAVDLLQHHGLAILVLPESPGARSVAEAPNWLRTPFVQSDLALSLLDYLDLATGSDRDAASDPPFGGRSLFRQYPDDRPLLFANTYLGWAAQYSPRHGLVVCNTRADTLASCRRVATDGPLRPLGVIRTTGGSGVPDLLRRWLGHAPPTVGAPGSVMPLTVGSVFRLADGAPRTLLFAGQGLDLPPGMAARVSLEARVAGAPGWLHLRTDLLAHELRLPPFELPALAPGDRLELHYRLSPAEGLEGLGIRAVADVLSGGPLEIHIERAELRFETARSDAKPLEILSRRFERAAPPPWLTVPLQPEAAEIAPCVSPPRSTEKRSAADPESEVESVVWRMDSCSAGEILGGPSRYVAVGSRLVVSWQVESLEGRVTVRGIVGSRRPPIAIAQSPTVTLETGDRRQLTLDTEVEAALDRLDVALFLLQGDAGARWQVTGVDVRVEPP